MCGDFDQEKLLKVVPRIGCNPTFRATDMPAKNTSSKSKNPNAGISRINQPEKRTFGFFVRLMRKGRIYNAFFADKSYGGKQKALGAARLHYRKLVRQHGPVTRKLQNGRVGRRG